MARSPWLIVLNGQSPCNASCSFITSTPSLNLPARSTQALMNPNDSSSNIPMCDRRGSVQTATLHTKEALNPYHTACLGHDVISSLGRGGGVQMGSVPAVRLVWSPPLLPPPQALHTCRGWLGGGSARGHKGIMKEDCT